MLAASARRLRRATRFANSRGIGDRGATDYFAELIPVGMVTEAFPDNGIGFSFATNHPDGFGNDDLQLIEAVLPAVSLAIVSDAEHTIAAGLLAAYLGSDVGRRVHAGVVERGSVENPGSPMVRGYPRLHSNSRRNPWASSR